MSGDLLPDAVLLLIFDRLSEVKDYGRSASVCRQWWHLLRRTSRVLEGLALSLLKRDSGVSLTWPSSSPQDDFFLALLSALPFLGFPSLHLNRLEARDCLPLNSPFHCHPLSHWSPACLSSLSSLQLHSSSIPASSLSSLTRLTSLSLQSVTLDGTLVSQPERVSTFTASISRLTLLQFLNVESTELCAAGLSTWQDLSDLRDLRLFNISFPIDPPPEFRLSFFSSLTRLTQLKLINQVASEGSALPPLPLLQSFTGLPHSFKSLTSPAQVLFLHLVFWQQSFPPPSMRFLSLLPRLQGVRLLFTKSCWPVCFLSHIAKHLQTTAVRSLDIHAHGWVADEGSMAAICGLTQLRELSIGFGTSAASLQHLRRLSALTRLEFARQTAACRSAVGNEQLQQVARCAALEELKVGSFVGGREGLRWLRVMLRLRRVVLGEGVEEELLQAVPRELLGEKPAGAASGREGTVQSGAG